ncbi:MAG TPA: site-specific integrase [Verrucomicrobiae bacterium]
MRTPTFPEEVKDESCTVTIYEREYTKPDKEGKPKKYLEYRLAWYEDGKRQFKTSADYLALRSEADEVLKDLKEGRRTTATAGLLTASQRNEYARAVKIVQPTGVALDVAATHFAKAVEILGSDLVVLAAQEYAKRHEKITPRLVSETVDEFLEEKERQKKSARHVQTLDSHLTRFKGSFAATNIASVTASELDLFLDNLTAGSPPKPVSARTRDNYANSIVTLFEWAKVKRYAPGDFDEHTRITRTHNDEDGPIDIYTPAELRALLGKADAKLVPFLTIGAFAGLRSSEIMRLDWSDVRMENGDPCIVVQKGKVKMRGKSRRIVPMSANLKAWLKKHAKASGPVWPFSVPYLYEMLRELTPKAQAALRKSDRNAKLEWKSNALRHSCISYRVAQIKNIPQVALESGNSPQMIDSNYRELVTEPDAQAWFAIAPKGKKK